MATENNQNIRINSIEENENATDNNLEVVISEHVPLYDYDSISYWILGFCNDFGIYLILVAALDIVEHFTEALDTKPNNQHMRPCHFYSTGVILLADSLPVLLIKTILPFSPLWISARIAIKIGSSFCGFILVATGNHPIYIILGVILVSGSAGLGETTLLQYSAQFNSNAIAAWSSGTGAAGLIGACIYTCVKSFDTNYKIGFLIMLFVPITECIVFFRFLRKPSTGNIITKINTNDIILSQFKRPVIRKSVHFPDEPILITCNEKFKYIGKLSEYIVPLIVISLAENLINHGMYQLIYFENTIMQHSSQYRWLNVIYQIGNFMSRSSIQFYQFNTTWIMCILQCINLIYFSIEVVYYVTPTIWIIFVIVFWEGLLAGAAFVNTFYKMLKHIPPTRQEFAIGVVSISVPLSIITAGLLTIPIHNAVCVLEKPIR